MDCQLRINLESMPFAPQELRTFFITAVTANRRRLFQVHSNADLLLNLFQEDRAKGRYRLHAFVLMPDHIHLVLTPAPDISIEKAMQFIKGGFSFRLRSKIEVWQSGFAKRRMEDAWAYSNHVNYLHENPVRGRLCERAEEFFYSSASGVIAVDPAPIHLTIQG